MKKNNSDKFEIIYNPIIIYSDNGKESFDVIKKTKKGVIIGRFIKGQIFDCGFIPKKSIKEIKRKLVNFK